MTFIHDHLIAVLIGTTVFLMLFAMTARLSEAKVEQATLYQAKAASLDFAEWLEDDLAEVGARVAGGRVAHFDMPTRDGGQTVAFMFHRDLVSVTFDTTRVTTRYALVPTDLVLYADTAVQRYQLVRATREAAISNGTAAWTTPWQPNGAGPATLTYFDVEPLTPLGQPAATPAEAEFLRLGFSIAQPQHGPRSSFRELHWATTLALRED